MQNTISDHVAEFTIDDEFKGCIAPQSEEENSQLETNMIEDGCRDPLVVWRQENILLDGHHRFEICKHNDIPFNVSFKDFDSREDAFDWVILNQLGRRNLTPEAVSYLRGKLYLREKKTHGGTGANQYKKEQSGNCYHSAKTSDNIAGSQNVSQKTVRNDAKFASAVDKLEEISGHDFKRKILSRDMRVSKKDVVKIAELAEEEPEQTRHILDDIKSGNFTGLASTVQGEDEILQAAKDIRSERAEQKKLENEQQLTTPIVLPQGKFNVIVIDPPWPMKKIERDVRPNQVEFDYPTMTETELREFDIKRISYDDCHLFMWTTQKFLPLAINLLSSWGYRYVLTMVWHKPGGFQPIGLPQYNCEFVLYGRKGTPNFVDTKSFPCCFTAPRREHSRKPDEFYDIVKRVTNGQRIDVFSRERREGFEQYGNEIGKF